MHAEAEERLFYPALLEWGRGADGKTSPEAETIDAIEDHNELREAVASVAGLKVGGAAWRKAVGCANRANSDHMGEEERQGLTDFRQRARLRLRHDLAIQLAVFEAEHIKGVRPIDKDPKAYIAKHGGDPKRA